MSNITVGRILLLDLVFLVNSALTLVVFKFVGLLDGRNRECSDETGPSHEICF